MTEIPEIIDVDPESTTQTETAPATPTTAMIRAVDAGPVSNAKMIQNVKDIKDMMKSVMIKDLHFGTIPGCGDKPVLLKPGAEKLSMMFHLAPWFDVKRTNFEGGHREYQITYKLTNQNTGAFVGEGVGLCSTLESKYRWREPQRKCPKCGVEAIIKGKVEYGGGWLCWAKKDGCGAKFEINDTKITSQKTERIENPDLADQYNTVLKIAKKRAHVDAIITACSASDIFAQDIEDMPELNKGSQTPPAASQDQASPQTASNAPTAPQASPAASQQAPSDIPNPWRGTIALVKVVGEGKSSKGPWSIKKITGTDGTEFTTYSDTFANNASSLEGKDYEVVIEWVEKVKGKYTNMEIESLTTGVKYDRKHSSDAPLPDDIPDPNQPPAGAQQTLQPAGPDVGDSGNIPTTGMLNDDDIPF